MKNKPLIIAGTTIQPGERKTIELPAATLYTQTSVNIPVHIIHGTKPGPCVFLTAAIHGDEVNGIEIIRRLSFYSALKHLSGTLITIPIANVYGFITLSRYLPDRRDLNRSFPGSKSGSLAARLANLLMEEIITKCTHGIDLHTGRMHLENLPQIRTNIDSPAAFDMAQAFNAPIIIDAKLRDGSLRQAATELNIPVLLYEAGQALRFDEFAIRAGVKGVINVLHSLGMIKRHTKKSIESSVARFTSWIRAPESGVVNHLKKLGSTVTTGEALGTISNPFTKKEQEIIATFDGIIIGWIKLPCINEGDAIYHIASFKEIAEVSEQIDQLQSELI